MIAKSAKTWHIHDMHSRCPFKKGTRVERGEKYAYSRYPHKKGTRIERGEIYRRKTLIGRAQIERGDIKKIRLRKSVMRNPSVKRLKEDMHG